MQSKLTKQDYISVLKFYKKDIPNSYHKIKDEAEKLLSDKLCKCIKSVGKKEDVAIPICKKSVVERKGFKVNKFTCKNKKTIKLTKEKKNKTRKSNRK